MIIAKGYVQTDKALFTPGEVIPDDLLSAEDLEWFQRIGMIRVTAPAKPAKKAAPKVPETAPEAPVEAIPETVPEEIPEAAPEVDAADAVVIPKAKTSRKKGGKRG